MTEKSCARKVHNRCVIVDVETTGLSASRGGRIIEIGAVAIDEGRISGEFHSLIDAETHITSGALKIHGITSDMLAGQPKPESVFRDFRRFIRDSILVAHNASFDVTFLRYEFGRLGLGLNNPYHCTLTMCRRHFPNLRDHKLETVYRRLFGPPFDGTRLHRALDDARMVARVWMEMMKK